MAKKKVFSPVMLLQIALAVYFIAFGLLGIIGFSSNASGGYGRLVGLKENGIATLVIGIIVMICGGILIGSLFVQTKHITVFVALLCIMVVWAAKIIVVRFVDINLDALDTTGWIEWISLFVSDLVIMVSLWVVARE